MVNGKVDYSSTVEGLLLHNGAVPLICIVVRAVLSFITDTGFDSGERCWCVWRGLGGEGRCKCLRVKEKESVCVCACDDLC